MLDVVDRTCKAKKRLLSMDKEFWNQLAKERIQAWQLQMFHHEEEKECVIARPAPTFSYCQTSCKNPNGQAHTSRALISIH